MALNKRFYSVNGRILGERPSGRGRVNYGVDALGSVIATLMGSVVENRYAYKPYGTQLAKSGGAGDPTFLWIGSKGYRPSVRIYSDAYVRARHYAPTLGRWSSPDPVGSQPSLYSYVSNPCTLKDPSGLQPTPECVEGPCVGADPDPCRRELADNLAWGCTDCNVDMHEIYIWIDSYSDFLREFPDTEVRRFQMATDYRTCIFEHEGVHRDDTQHCCHLTRECMAYYKGRPHFEAKQSCWGYWKKYKADNKEWSEYIAYVKSRDCFRKVFRAYSCEPRQALGSDDTGFMAGGLVHRPRAPAYNHPFDGCDVLWNRINREDILFSQLIPPSNKPSCAILETIAGNAPGRSSKPDSLY